MIVPNLSRIIIFSIIFLLLGFQNVAYANQSIISLSPSNIYVDETTTFTIEFTPAQNLSNVIMHFVIDAEEKGTKKLNKVLKNETYFITFDYSFNKNSYLGEHYIELKTDFIAENQEKISENFYTAVNVYEKRPPTIYKINVSFFLLGLYFIILIGGFIYSKLLDRSIIEFVEEERKFLFKSIVTFLPISISIFTLYLAQKPELKIGILTVLLAFITSFFSALYLFIIAEKENEPEANNFTLYTLCFIFLGLIDMIVLILFF